MLSNIILYYSNDDDKDQFYERLKSNTSKSPGNDLNAFLERSPKKIDFIISPKCVRGFIKDT